MNYLVKQATIALRVETLKFKEVSLDELMTAYLSRYNQESVDQRVSQEISGVAQFCANILMAGKFAAIYDRNDNTQYFIKAFDGELIAISYAVGGFLNVFEIKATSPELLESLNIKSSTINDKKIVDRLLGFSPMPTDEEIEKEKDLARQEYTGHHFPWFRGVKRDKPAAVPAIERADHGPRDPAETVGEAVSAGIAARGGNQMQSAFSRAQSRGERHHGHQRSQS